VLQDSSRRPVCQGIKAENGEVGTAMQYFVITHFFLVNRSRLSLYMAEPGSSSVSSYVLIDHQLGLR
jgi:hypothetical protein